MSIFFLTKEQIENYGKYPENLTQEELNKYFYLNDYDKKNINKKRRDYNKLGFAIQLSAIRYLGTFVSFPLNIPEEGINYLSKQLSIESICIRKYALRNGRQFIWMLL